MILPIYLLTLVHKKDASSDSQVLIDDQSFDSQSTSILLHPLMHVEKPHN